MDLRFLGVGGAFAPALGNNCAMFTRGEDLYMLDCGEQAFMRLMRADIFTKYPGQITAIITHLHGDHVGSLATLCLYADSVLGRRVTVVHPHDNIEALLALMGVAPGRYTLLRGLTQPGLEITPIPVHHAPGIHAFAYLISDESGMYYYSGDTGEIPLSILDRLREGQLTRAYLDVTDAAASGAPSPHLSYETLLGLIPPTLRGRITLMHFNRDYRAKATQDGFACAVIDPLFAEG